MSCPHLRVDQTHRRHMVLAALSFYRHFPLSCVCSWYRVLYCSLTDQNTYGMGLETLTPELLSDLAAAPPGPPPSLGVPRSEGATPACTHTHPHPHSHAHASSTSTAAAAAVAAAGGGGGSGHTAAGVGTAGGVGAGGCQQQLACGRDRCSSCWLPLRLGCMAYVGSCGHSFHFECLKGLGGEPLAPRRRPALGGDWEGGDREESVSWLCQKVQGPWCGAEEAAYTGHARVRTCV